MSVAQYSSFLQVIVFCDINMRSIHSISCQLFVLFAVLSIEKLAGCTPITNSDLTDRIREFSSKDDNTNSTGIKTLQKEESEKYANFSPVHHPGRFKDVSDSALSSSSHGRGLLHHEHPGYTLHDYEESPPIYGYEYHAAGHGPDYHGFDHHAPDHYHGHHGGHRDVKYYHKHYDHALAAKAFLWPIAGIALLGAAAAFVTNPVLLQLGVVSGRRKRRDTEEIFDTQSDADLSWLKNKDEQVDKDPTVIRKLMKKSAKKKSDEMSFVYKGKSHDVEQKPMSKYSVKQAALFKKLRVHPTVQSPVEVTMETPRRFSASKYVNENKLIPVPLISKEKA